MPWPKQVIKIKHLIGGFLTVSEGKSKIIIARSMIIGRHGIRTIDGSTQLISNFQVRERAGD